MDAKQALLALAINLAEMTVQRDDERAQVAALQEQVADLERRLAEHAADEVEDVAEGLDVVDND